MSILVGRASAVVVQGITGRQGLFHTQRMLAEGTAVVAGVSPGKGGMWVEDRVPVFDTVATAVEATGADTSLILVPAAAAKDAMLEAAEAGISLVICVTANVPVADMMIVRAYMDQQGVRLLGPASPGLVSPGEVGVGVFARNLAPRGRVGVVTRSGTLAYEALAALGRAGVGVSTCVGLGGDPVKGLSLRDVLRLFQEDVQTEQVVLIGEMGGNDEEAAAAYIADRMTKRVVAYVAGQSAPPGRAMGHALTIVHGTRGSTADKIEKLRAANVQVARHIEEIPLLVA